LRRLQGGCSIPVFGLSQKSGSLTGGIVSLDGAEILKETIAGINPEEIGKALAEKILSLGGDRILEEIKTNL
jgi:hydroxymethylbilane synthase